MFRLFLFGAAIVVGMAAAMLLFPPQTDSIISHFVWKRIGIDYNFSHERAKGLRYTGTVIAQDLDARTLTLAVHSDFPFVSSTTPVRFVYDDDSQWFSFQHVFKDAILEKRLTVAESPRNLPNETLVTLVIDPRSTSELYAIGIYFLRKTEL